ncbi:hypothetical protein V1511DRAFT_494949 [Dipodascopsis uninucleata]
MVRPIARNLSRRLNQRPWYVTAADIFHRLTVLTLMGGTLYYVGFTGYALWWNHSKRQEYFREHPEELERIKQEKLREKMQATGEIKENN